MLYVGAAIIYYNKLFYAGNPNFKPRMTVGVRVELCKLKNNKIFSEIIVDKFLNNVKSHTIYTK